MLTRALVGTIAAGLTFSGCTAAPDDSTTGPTTADTTTAGDASSGTTTSSSTGTSATADPGTSTTSGSGTSTTAGSSTDSGTTDSGTTASSSDSGATASSSDSGTTDSGSGTTAASSSDSGTTTTGPPVNPLRVFVTSETHSGNYVGTDGADTFCNDLALAAGLSGTYTAWLSTSTEDAASRIDPAGEPYLRVDGTVVANDLADLLDGTLEATINLDEHGLLVFGDVWTGTVTDGTADPAHCSDWTAEVAPEIGRCGSSGSTSSTWTNNITPSCGTGLRLYCFEQG